MIAFLRDVAAIAFGLAGAVGIVAAVVGAWGWVGRAREARFPTWAQRAARWVSFRLAP